MENTIPNQPDLSSDTRSLVEQSFGMWVDRADIDDNWLAKGRNLWQSVWRLDEWVEGDELEPGS
jgi:hypothetical protein